MEKIGRHTADFAYAALMGMACALYAGFLCLDLLPFNMPRLCDAFKLCSIICCFALTLRYRDGQGRLLSLAMLLSVLADWLLLYTRAYASGVVCFCCVQLLHIRRFRPGISWLCLATTTVVAAAMVLAGLASSAFNTLYALCALYAVLIGVAFACAWGGPALARAGMLMFVVCDMNVAVYNLMPPGGAAFVPYMLMWAVYVPAQLLLALSGRHTLTR